MNTILFSGCMAAGASACSAGLLNAGKFDICWCAIIGMCGWIVYSIINTLDGSFLVAYAAASFLIAIFSELLAFSIKNPATVYLLPSLFPLVPGYGMFSTMRSIIIGETKQALYFGHEALLAAGAIAFGIALASSLARLFYFIKTKKMEMITLNNEKKD
ncbi:MAG: threonine/serine exporter family protein [Treponemataceae bacterium]